MARPAAQCCRILSAVIILLFPSSVLAQSHAFLEIQARADEGDQGAQLELAKAYLAGGEVPRDRVVAYFWFNLAVAGGGYSQTDMARSNEARAARDKLEKVLSSEQITQAEAMGREWKPKEVLGSASLKAIFAEHFNLFLWPTNGYAAWRTEKKVTGHEDDDPNHRFERWETSFRFPGNHSWPCETTMSGKDFATFDCQLFYSQDIDQARAVYSSVQRYIWDLLPSGWYRGVAEDMYKGTPLSSLMKPLDSTCFSSSRSGMSVGSDARHAASVRLSLEGATPFYSVALEFSPLCTFGESNQLEQKGAMSSRSSSASPDIRSQIDEIVKSGKFSALPEAQSTGSGPSGEPKVSIANHTAYTLTVLMDGPVERSITVAPGGTENVGLPPGAYRVLGRVTSGNVMPFFGARNYATGTTYQESFVVGTR